MRWALRRVQGFLLVAVTGCQSHAETEAQHDDHEAEHEHAEGEASHDEAEPRASNLLEVEPSMLRDLKITTSVVEARPAGDMVTALGELRVNEEAYAEVGSPISARVVQTMVSPGDPVKAGQVLVELQSGDIGRARADVLAAKTRVQLAEQVLARQEELAVDQIVPQRTVQASKAELAQARAELQAAQVAVSAVGGGARKKGARGSGTFTLSAPIAGTILDREALRGRLIDPAHTLFSVADLSRLWLVVHAFERDALRLREGTIARVTFPALPAEAFDGVVTRIGSKVDPASRTLDVRIEIDNPQNRLRPGMSATARIPVGESSQLVVTVPVVSLQRLPQGWVVFVPTKEKGAFEIRQVGRGRDLGGEVELLSGVKAGERVVVDGAFLLKAESDKARGGGEEHHH